MLILHHLFNTAIGFASFKATTCHGANARFYYTAVGNNALRLNTTGANKYCSWIGSSIMKYYSTGGNTALGYSALTANTTGVQ